jgi:NADH dehydrogenase [ubiquinone] 1 alpha subcomplex assembly factor 7
MPVQNELGSRIARLIRNGGPLSIAEFMTFALHDPKAGYYATRDPLGADFITAPEMTQIFGELLGLWCAQVWQEQGKPSPACFVELGPGRGTLISDALRALERVPEFLDSLEVVLVEASPVLTAKQRERLRHHPAPIRWVRHASEIRHDRTLFVIANEFLDALPVQQFVMTQTGWRERVVNVDGDHLSFALAPAPLSLRVPAQRGVAIPGAVYEVSPAAGALVQDLAHAIASTGGAAIFLDYGYDSEEFGDTFQAIGQHRFEDILRSPGEVDLSCHVDFTAMARMAQAEDVRVYGPIEQGQFLQALGIETRLSTLAAKSPVAADAQAVARLTDRRQMGSLFKALAILPKNAPPPPGFAKV